jgi:protein lysine acetyltransferase
MVVSLQNGQRFHLRPIRPEDKDALVEALHHLSEDTVYKRFLSPKPDFTSAELRYLTELDGHDHYALVAVPVGRPTEIHAVGRFVRLREEPATAEVAVVVGDELQGMGLGTQLGLALADAARERGVRQFTATILGQNVAAQRLMHSISARVREGRPEGSLRNLVLELDPGQPGVLGMAA